MEPEETLLRGDKEQVNRRLTYLVFISAVAVMAFVNALLYYLSPNPLAAQVLWVMDFAYALIFLFDFLARLKFAESKSTYMLHWGWLDLLTSIPGIPALRLVRSVRAAFASRALLSAAPDDLGEEARSRLAESVLLIATLMGLLVVTLGSIGVVNAESGAAGASIETGYDAVWWSLVTISTIGYGDMVPVTPAGRTIGVFMIFVGVGLFTTLTSYLASNFTDRAGQRQRRQQIELAAKNQQAMEALMQRMMQLEAQIAGKLNVDVSTPDAGEKGEGDSA
jgi:voltage-gated potassium channel